MLPKEKATVAGAWIPGATSSHKMKTQDMVPSPSDPFSCFRGLDAWILSEPPLLLPYHMTPSNLRTFGASHQDRAEGTWVKSTFSSVFANDPLQLLPKLFTNKPTKNWHQSIWNCPTTSQLPTDEKRQWTSEFLSALAELHRPRVVFATPWTCLASRAISTVKPELNSSMEVGDCIMVI